MGIGDNLKDALASLLSQEALNIEIDRGDDKESLLKSIIQANKNLSESTNNNNWEMIGTDLNELQTLINSLEKLLEEEKKQKVEEKDNAQNNIHDNEEIKTNEQNLTENTGN